MTEAGNNYSEKKTQLHISVRNLVEFIFREGDIDNRSSRAMSADAMMEGTRIHRKIQGSMGKEYQAEVPLSLVVEGDLYELTVEGRADGIFTEDGKCFVFDFLFHTETLPICHTLPSGHQTIFLFLQMRTPRENT